jgi:hypothetical protein
MTSAVGRGHISILIGTSLVAILVGCDEKKAAELDIPPVRTVTTP